MLNNSRFALLAPSLLIVALAGITLLAAAEKEARTDGPLLIQVERESRDDLSKLLSAGLPVVMEMRDSLFVEGGTNHLRWLDGQGYSSAILDESPLSSDYLVVGIRPDSSMERLRASGVLLLQEDNWVLMRVPRGASIDEIASEKVFITRMPREPLRMPKQNEEELLSRASKLLDPDPLVQAIVDQVQTPTIDQLWADLTSNPPTGTRYSTHQGCFDAADYCYDYHDGLGLSVAYQEWSTSHAPNVIATQTGALYPDDIYIVLGHLDDLPMSGLAPGADDNGTGSVTVLEAARVMSCYAFESTVKYLNVTGEEHGLLGSDYYAEDAAANGDNILGVINMDMNGWEGDGIPDPEDLDLNYNTASEWLALLFSDCAETYNTGLVVDAFYCPSLTASDHYPFWQEGWSAVCGITDNEGYCGHGGYYPYYHTSNDTIANCGDPTFFYSAVRASVATLAQLARPFKIITDSSAYACGSEIGVLVGDRDLNADPGLQESLIVEAWSDTETTREAITLGERSADSMLFEGSVPTTLDAPSGGDGLVSVAPGDTVTIRYVDATDCDGSTAVEHTATARIDCVAPVITNVAVSGVTGAEAMVSWDTDEPADSLVTYGELAPGTTVAAETLVTAHGLRLEGLDECTIYLFSVSSADAAGNSATDDNQGAFYSFATGVNNQPEYDSTDTPIPITDYNTITSDVIVADDDVVLDVDVRLNATHTYTGDLDIFLIGPTGTRVELSSDNGGTGENFTDTIFDDEAAVSITSGSAPFTGSFRPEGSLATLDGISSLGTWTLEITDDAGSDQGQLLDWTLILTFEAQQCGPVLTYLDKQLEVDSCPTDAAGAGNDLWEVGEHVEFSLSVRNDGTGRVTSAITNVTALTPGVVMVDASAKVGDLDPGITGITKPPHLIAHLTEALTCGQTLEFQVDMVANEGSWPATFEQIIGEVVPERSGMTLSEDFSTGIPAAWTIVDGEAPGHTWFADDAADPAGCGSPDPLSPFAGRWAAVDSDCTGGGDRMDEELISPPLDFTGDPVVTLEFDHWFEWSPGMRDEVADVDIRSSLTGGAWVNVARFTGASTANPQHEIIDISAHAADAPDVQVRWRYYNGQSELYWYVDNVEVHYFDPEDCLNESCAASVTSPPPVPGGAAGTSPILVSRLEQDGSRLSIDWDDQCSPASTRILYGDLGQLATHALSGAVCDIAKPAIWEPVPAGNIWFLLVSDDGLGVESSWGEATDGERNGLSDSGMCGCLAKDITGSCP
jgi:subtilisin-like proprotein convertase family protein